MLSKKELNMLKNSKLPWTIFEIYTIGGPDRVSGWEIEFVVIQADKKEARKLITEYPNFDCIITMDDWLHQEQAVIFRPPSRARLDVRSEQTEDGFIIWYCINQDGDLIKEFREDDGYLRADVDFFVEHHAG